MRAVVSGVGLVVITILFGAVITLSALVSPSGGLMMPLGRAWSRWVLGFAGVRVQHLGAERARTGQPVLFMSNHQSMLDIPAIALVMPDTLRFIAKSSLQWVPFFGWAMKATGGCIFIDRGNRAGAVESLKRAGERIRSGHSVLVFPEGTRSPAGVLGELKKGPFHLAAAARVPIVPIVVRGSSALMTRGSLGIRSGEVEVRFGEPIAVAPGATPAELAATVKAALAALLAAGA